MSKVWGVLSWKRLWSTTEPSSKTLPFILTRMSVVLAVYVASDWLLGRFTALPETSYQQKYIIWGLVQHLVGTELIWLMIPVLGIILFFSKRMATSWGKITGGRWMRFLVGLATCILAWVFCTYDYNLYLDQSHLVDRLLLLGIALLVLWRPAFVFPFLVVLLSIIGQFTLLGGFSWAAPYPLIRIVLAFGVYFIIYVITGNYHLKEFLVFTCSLYLSHYWVPGTGKIDSWWLFHDQVNLLLPATYANGWLAFVEPDTLSKLTEALGQANFLIKSFTIVAECGVLFFFWHKTWARIVLLGCILMQTGIFMVSGINFWMWMVMNVAMIYLFTRKDAFGSIPVFTLPYKIISSILILGSPLWFNPVKLSWKDVPVSYTYKFSATTANNQIINLPPSFFAPYDDHFTLGAFRYMVPDPVMPIVWGVTGNQQLAEWLSNAPAPEAVFSYEMSHGKVFFDSESKKHLENFIIKTISTWNSRKGKELWITKFKAPQLIWTFPLSADVDSRSPINRIDIIQITSYFREGSYSEIRKTPIHSLILP